MPHYAKNSKQKINLMRWCIYIDLLGFSKRWESEERKVLDALNELMRAIFRIGVKVYPNEGERLFVHHMGDGFAIVSDFGEESFERPLGIATALMRHLAANGEFAAAAVSEGEFSDISGCYPDEVMKASEDSSMVNLGEGLMTLNSVMGTAFISAYRLQADIPPGPFVVVSEEHQDRVLGGFQIRKGRSKKKSNLLSIDWIRSDCPTIAHIQRVANLCLPKDPVQEIRSYCDKYSIARDKWPEHLRTLLGVALQGS